MCKNDLVSISLLVFGITRGNEFHSHGKDRSVLSVVKECFEEKTCVTSLYVRKTMLHTKIVQMKIIKMSIVIYSYLNTKQEQCVSTHLSTCYIQNTMLETGICGMPIHL